MSDVIGNTSDVGRIVIYKRKTARLWCLGRIIGEGWNNKLELQALCSPCTFQRRRGSLYYLKTKEEMWDRGMTPVCVKCFESWEYIEHVIQRST